MATLQWCSVADVTVRVKATLAQAASMEEGVWWGGTWFGIYGTMYYRIVTTGGNPGLYYWDPDHAEHYYNNYTVTTDGAGTLVQAFVDGALDVTLRFRIVTDGEAYQAETTCDEVVVDTYTPPPPGELEDPLALADLVSWLAFNAGGKSVSGAGSETFRVGVPEATVWECEVAGTVKVKVSGGAPAVVASASRNWTVWVPVIQAGTDPADYRAGGDLFGDGFVGADQLTVDGDGCVYGLSQEGDSFLSSQQITFNKYCLAEAVALAIAHHAVSNTLLVTDAGLATGGGAGHHKVQRTAEGYTWSQRYALDDSAGATAANIIATPSRLDLVVGTASGTQFVPMGSLEGGWGEPVTFGSGLQTPFGLELGERHLVAVVSGQRTWVYVVAPGGEYEAVGEAVGVHAAFGSPQYPVLAMHPTTWRMFVAVWHGTATVVNSSHDRGATWADGVPEGVVWAAQVDNLQYPYLFCDDANLWLVGYEAGAYRGATGKCVLTQYRAQEDLAVVQSAVTVGPCDAGRPAIFRRPGTRELIAVLPKTGSAWDDFVGETGAGIVEARSVDYGATWGLQDLHLVE